MHAIPRPDTTRGTAAFFALACATTWLLAAPAVLAWTHHTVPSPGAVACAGLSAFGPLLAALVVAGRQKNLREVFGHWRASPLLVLLALLTPLAVHLAATALDAATGGHPAAWLHPPRSAQDVAALVVFSLGEEFGWRGFAHARMARRHGPVRGALLVGVMWGVWHLAYAITPAAGGFDPAVFALNMLELPLYSLPIAWVFERSNRSMAVAIAFHAGAHLDHLERDAAHDLRLQACQLVIVLALALVAARSLGREGSGVRGP